MGKIFCLMGKSSSGKDTIYKKLLEQKDFPLFPIIPCTTRPIRKGETPGVEYHFYTEAELQKLIEDGKVIELRSYYTVHGIWKYFTSNEHIDLTCHDYFIIGTLESYQKMKTYFGKDHIVPLYLFVDDGVRLQRALDRERSEEHPRYAEMCRRFLADEQDFSEERLKAAEIQTVFYNQDLSKATKELYAYIKEILKEN